MDDAILILTRKGMPSFVKDGGSGNWKIRPSRVHRLSYAVLCRNRNSDDPAEGDEPHGSGFLVARVSGVTPSREPGRFVIQFSEIAKINKADLWPGYRVPTTYTSMASLGIDVATLDWQPLPTNGRNEHLPTQARANEAVGEIIRRHKEELSKELGIPGHQIEILVRV
jgi:hypothetical protein